MKRISERKKKEGKKKKKKESDMWAGRPRGGTKL